MSDDGCGSESDERNRRAGCQTSIPLSSDGGSDLDRFFEALADDRRRLVLVCLQKNETTSFQELAELIADREEVDQQSEAFDRIRAELMHLHLPKLADHGLLSFDSRTKNVSHEQLPTAVEEILELSARLEESVDSDISEE